MNMPIRSFKERYGVKGLGDVVHLAAQPIAKVIDKTLGTDVQSCGGCKRRREALNRAIPFAKKEENQ